MDMSNNMKTTEDAEINMWIQYVKTILPHKKRLK
jgi:hypothetical protein